MRQDSFQFTLLHLPEGRPWAAAGSPWHSKKGKQPSSLALRGGRAVTFSAHLVCSGLHWITT